MKTTVGIDPGLTTGLCFFRGEKLVWGREAQEYWEIADFIMEHSPDAVVLENYIVGKRPSRPKEPLKVIGVVEYLCSEWEIELVVQSPSILSRMLPETKGMHESKHVRAACSHVLYYLEKGGVEWKPKR